MIAHRKEFSLAQIWLFSFLISLTVIESVTGGVEMLLTGTVNHEDLLAGLAASLVVTILVGGGLNFWLIRQGGSEVYAEALPEEQAADLAEEAGTAESVAPVVVPPYDIAGAMPTRQECGSARHADIRRSVRNLEVLPAMPMIAQRLLALRLDTEKDEQKLLELIGQDAQISAKILGLANSAIVGASREIKTIREAAMLLGTKRVQSAATGIAIISLMAKTPGEFNIHDLWLHSIRVAFAMQGIARAMPREMRPQDEQIFLAGILHDIGYLVLAYLDPKLSDRLHNRLAAEPGRPAIEVEREILDICHDELGAELAMHWNLPEEIIAVLRYHHNPDAPEALIGQPLVRMINLAEKLQPSFGIVEYVAPEIAAGEWEALGIDTSRAEEVQGVVDEQLEQAMQLAASFT